MVYNPTPPHRFGLGIGPAAVPVYIHVAKNTYSFLKRLFGPKPLVWGLKPEEFEDRHNNARWFRGLWYSGYWARDGAPEIPSGMTTQDYYVGRFNLGPMWGDSADILASFQKNGVPLSSLRLTYMPEGMSIPSSVSPEALDRVLPLSVIQSSAPAEVSPVVSSTVAAGLGDTLPLLLLVGVGMFLILRK